jgi:hypothetical protein
MMPPLGSFNLLEKIKELGKHFICSSTFIIKAVAKGTDEQPDGRAS